MLVNSMIDMILGMSLGMVVSPLMMKAFKSIRQKRRVNRILHEISEFQRAKQQSVVTY
jgi:glucose uptake protein GlcU